MARIYVSSTYADLKDYRETVYRTLRQMGHDVIAMEDYVATDQRPVVKCLADVAGCDLYLGLFAWRYGFVPPPEHGNPGQKSITELEYRKALETGKPCRLFLLQDGTPWPQEWKDRTTGENEAGGRIAALRGELGRERMVGLFDSATELGRQVSISVGQWERLRLAPPAGEPGFWERWQAWLAATVFARRNTRRYVHTLETQHRELSFLGRATPLDLEHIYVSLKVGEHNPPALQPDAPDGAAEVPAPEVGRSVDVPEALALGRRLVVLGEPGSGKTTLLKYLVLQLARRDPRLAPFARALMPTPLTRVLEPTVRFLSGASVFMPGLLASLAALVVWLVQVFRSPTPLTALGLWVLFLVALFLLWVKPSRRSTLVGAGLALGGLAYAVSAPGMVGRLTTGLMGLGVALWLYPYWIRPPLALLRRALRRATRYPLPVYLTLNNLAHDARPIEAHLAAALAGARFAHGERFLARRLERGGCMLLLDALDEVVDPTARQRVVAEVNRLRTAHGEGNEILVTSRIAGFPGTLTGYRQLEVEALKEAQIAAFVHGWFAETPDAQARERRVEGLLQALGHSPRMRALASNPLLLSLMTLLYENRWELPERRAEVYEECVGLLTAEWDHRRGVTRAPRFSPTQQQAILTEVAVCFHQAGTRVLERAELLAALEEALPACGCGGADPGEALEELMRHTGLLRQKSRTSYDFVHLTFQEFFTARAFRQRGDTEALLAHAGVDWWREVIRLYAGLEGDATLLLERFRKADLLLAAGCLADARPRDTASFRRSAEAIVGDLQTLAQEDPTRRQEAADALADVGDWGAKDFLIDAVSGEGVEPVVALSALLALSQGADQATEARLLADQGRLLRLLHAEVPRAAPHLRTRILDLLERLGHPLAHVPAGEFRMGSDGDSADERPQHIVALAEHWIDRFPVTNAQYARFVEETGYRAAGDWRSTSTPGKERHPVVNVTWEDARAYAKWCGKRLPTEAEWEKAARGTDARRYPWGEPWDGNKCNVSGRGTTPVGHYPAGASPYGCHDMAGNVWEWVADWYDAGYYARSPRDNPRGPESGSDRVVRGGSWRNDPDLARAAYRNRGTPDDRYDLRGFRLVCASPIF